MSDSPPIVKTPGNLGGRPRINGRRIGVHDIVIWHVRLRTSVTVIARDYDLTLAQVRAALAYYHDHKDEIDQIIEEEDAAAERIGRPATEEELARLKELRVLLGTDELEMIVREVAN